MAAPSDWIWCCQGSFICRTTWPAFAFLGLKRSLRLVKFLPQRLFCRLVNDSFHYKWIKCPFVTRLSVASHARASPVSSPPMAGPSSQLHVHPLAAASRSCSCPHSGLLAAARLAHARPRAVPEAPTHRLPALSVVLASSTPAVPSTSGIAAFTASSARPH